MVAAKSTSKEHRPQQTPTLAPWAAAVQVGIQDPSLQVIQCPQ